MDTPSFVTVASFETSLAAWIYRNRLANQGLNPIIVDEHTVNVYWLYSNAIGGVKVQIPAAEITEFKSKLNLQTDYCFPSIVDDSNENLTSCPRCNSIEFHVNKWPKRLIFLTWLVFGFPIPIYSATTNCDDCGFEERPKFDIPKQFKIIHLLALTTLVALMLGVSINIGFDWVKLFAGWTVPRYIYLHDLLGEWLRFGFPDKSLCFFRVWI